MAMAPRASALLHAVAWGAQHPRTPAAAAAATVAVPTRSTATAAADGAGKARRLVGDYVPVYVALGMITVAVSLGLMTARQQLAYHPNVRPDKKKRETIPKVAAPDMALDEAERFVHGSLFRKVAHV